MVRPTPSGAVVFHILGEVDRSHTTATQFTLDRVAVGQGFFEPDYCFVGHGRTCSWSRTQGTAYRSWWPGSACRATEFHPFLTPTVHPDR